MLGSINIDLVATAQRLPTPGETIGGGRLLRQPGGKGANQATAASRLGASVRMIGAVGADADGVALVNALQATGVETGDVQVVDAPTGTALIAVDEEGENQIVVCPGANAFATIEGVDFLPNETVLTQLEIDMDLVLLAVARTTGFVAVNASPAQPLPRELIQRVDLFIVNETEYRLMPELKAARHVAVTYGAAGAALFADGSESARTSGFKTDVVNSVGAGDAFCAALTLALASGHDPHDALRLSCRVGAAAVGHSESQPPLDLLSAYGEGDLPSPLRQL